jgi:hypothetical protein
LTGGVQWPAGSAQLLFAHIFEPHDPDLLSIKKIYNQRIIRVIEAAAKETFSIENNDPILALLSKMPGLSYSATSEHASIAKASEKDDDRTETDPDRTETDPEMEKMIQQGIEALVGPIPMDFEQEQPLVEAPRLLSTGTSTGTSSRKRKQAGEIQSEKQTAAKRRSGISEKRVEKLREFLKNAIGSGDAPWWESVGEIAKQARCSRSVLHSSWKKLTDGTKWPAEAAKGLFKNLFDSNDPDLLSIKKIYNERIVKIIRVYTETT